MAETKTKKEEVKKVTAKAPVAKSAKSAEAKPVSKVVAPKPVAKPAPVKKAEPKVEKPPVTKPAPKKEPVTKKVEPVKKEVVKKSAPIKKEKGVAPYETVGEMRVVLVKGVQGCTKRQIRTVMALGLKRIGDERVHKDNPAIRGMCIVVEHLVKVEKI